jgi:hypothetical protein
LNRVKPTKKVFHRLAPTKIAQLVMCPNTARLLGSSADDPAATAMAAAVAAVLTCCMVKLGGQILRQHGLRAPYCSLRSSLLTKVVQAVVNASSLQSLSHQQPRTALLYMNPVWMVTASNAGMAFSQALHTQCHVLVCCTRFVNIQQGHAGPPFKS